MNTPAHMLIAAALFARSEDPRRALAAAAGGLAPDLSLFAMIAWERGVQGRPPALVYGHDFRDPFWQGIFAVDNSIPLWALATLLAGLLAWRAARPLALCFAAGGLLHVLADFFLHNEDARMQLQPFTDWMFRAPLSYWDVDRHAGIVGPVEALLALLAALILARRHGGVLPRIAFGLAATVELALGAHVAALAWAPEGAAGLLAALAAPF